MENTATGRYYGNLSALMVPCVICQDKLPRGPDGGASKQQTDRIDIHIVHPQHKPLVNS